MEIRCLKVGELARGSGVSVRTLHYYDEIGLLRPSQQTVSGYRLYGRADVQRLPPLELLRTHAGQLRARIQAETQLCERLEALAARLEHSDGVSLHDLLELLRETNKMDKFKKYYTPEQLQTLAQRGEELGEDGMQKGQRDWVDLIGDVQQAVQDGVDPQSSQGRSLAARWDALIEAFTGGDPGIRQSLGRMYQEEPDIAADHGYRPDPAFSGFIDAARKAR